MSSAIASAYDERFGLSIPEWRVIAVLTRYPRLSAREVADKSRMDAVAVSRAVNRLLRAGRLRRTVDARDRRRSVLEVSAAGAAVYRQIAPLAGRYKRSIGTWYLAAKSSSSRAFCARTSACSSKSSPSSA